MSVVKDDLHKLHSNANAINRVYTAISADEANIAALLSGGTTGTSQIHHVAGMTTANTSLTAFTVNNDGVTHAAAARILVRAQTAPEENGIYVVGTVTTGTAPLTRATDWDVAAEIKCNTIVAVDGGTAGANTYWQITGDFPITVGTTHQHFTQVRNATQTDAKYGLTTTPGGASYVGVFDTAGYFTGADVEAVLAEIWAKLIIKTTPGGASYVGVFDTAGYFTADTVEAVLAEIWAKLILTTTPGGASYIGVFDNAGVYTANNVEAALAEVKLIADAGVGAVKRTVNVVETSLTGTSQAVNIGAILPTNACVFMHEIVVNTQMVLAGNDLTITIGGTDADAIVASTDLDALTPGKYQGTLGVHPRGSFSGEQLVATFAASDLASLSAGDVTINVWYFILA